MAQSRSIDTAYNASHLWLHLHPTSTHCLPSSPLPPRPAQMGHAETLDGRSDVESAVHVNSDIVANGIYCQVARPSIACTKQRRQMCGIAFVEIASCELDESFVLPHFDDLSRLKKELAISVRRGFCP